MYVINANTGEVVFDKNSRVGLATASTLKIITAATAYELLGKDFRYETKIGYEGKIKNGVLDGNLVLIGSGDPTFGSWRWEQTKENLIFKKIVDSIKKLRVKKIEDVWVVDNTNWNFETIPDGWIWQDIGNYYGAGAKKLNWRENQFDIFLKSGSKIGDSVKIVSYSPQYIDLNSELTSQAKGSGDNAYVYYGLNESGGTIRGTIPIEENAFKISAVNASGPHT